MDLTNSSRATPKKSSLVRSKVIYKRGERTRLVSKQDGLIGMGTGREGKEGKTYLGELDALGGVVLGDLIDLVPPVGGAHVLQLVLLLELFYGREGGRKGGRAGKMNE